MWRSFWRSPSALPLLLSFLMWGIVPIAAQPIPATTDSLSIADPDGVIRLKILRVGDQLAIPGQGIVIPSMTDGATFDAEVGAYGLPDYYDVYLCAKPDDGPAYRCFGAARKERRETGDVFELIDARLSEAATQTRQYSLRAVALRKGQKLPNPVTSLDAFDAVSSPAVQAAVLEWKVSEDLSLGTIGARTIGPTRELSVEPTADVSGLRQPNQQGKTYLMVHWVGTKVWWVVETEIRGRTYYARDVHFSHAGFPHWRRVDLFAFVTPETLRPGPVDYAAVAASFQAVSPPVKLWLQDPPAPPPARTGTFTVKSYTCADGVPRRVNANTRVLQFTSPDCALDVTAEDLPQGAAVHVAITAAGGAEYIVQEGPALFTGKSFLLPRIRAIARDANTTEFFLYVFTASANVPSGPTDYATWQRTAIATSDRFVLRSGSANGNDSASSTADIELKIDPGADPFKRIEIHTQNMPPWLTVWVGAQWGQTGPWTFVPAQKQSETLWVAPPVASRTTRDGQREMPARLVAIATSGPIDPHQRDYVSWRHSAWKASDFVELSAPETTAAKDALHDRPDNAGVPPYLPPVLLAVLLVLLTLVLLQWIAGATALLFGTLRDGFATALEYVKNAFPGMPSPDPVKSVIGLTLAALGLFGIVSYLPLYQDVLRSALKLSASSSRSLSLLLTIFVGLTGVAAHITYKYWPGESRRTFAFTLVFTLIVLMAGALAAFQGIVYHTYYAARTPPGSLIPFALGAAAVFVAIAEMLIAFWVFELASAVVTWTLFHLVLFVPLALLKYAFDALAVVFAKLPRKDADKPPVENPRPAI